MGFYNGTIQKGSSGKDVKEWQTFLQSQGYDLSSYGGVDGVFGDGTLKYTKEWQKANGLTDDGIVGDSTWGKAGYKNVNTPTSAPTTAPAPTQPNLSYTPWLNTESGKVANNKRDTAEIELNKLGDFGENWFDSTKLDDYMSQYENRPDFSYDFNTDALYQQYKDKYIKQGKLAMQDTIGQASAMTGGYGNSYAQSVGNQAYQASLENLNDIIPELYQMAYDRYNQEGQDLLNMISMQKGEREFAYGQYTDKYNKLADALNRADSNFYNDANMYSSDQINANNTEQQNWQNEFNIWDAENTNAWKEAEFNEAVRQWAENMDFQKQQYEDSKKSYISSGSGSSSGGSSGGSSSGGSSGGSESGGSGATGTSSTDLSGIRSKLDGMTSDTQVEAYLENQVAAGVIDHDTALNLMAEYMDVNETIAEKDDNGNTNYRRKTYSEMASSTSGWKVEDDGGTNWFWGVDNNAIVIAPNGEKIRLDNLREKLKEEGMSTSDANKLIKKLQKNLGI